MKKLFTIGLAGALALACTAAPASAEISEFEDYEFSDAVWQMTTVKLDPGQFETYLEGLQATWIASNDVAKSLGQIEDYAIYTNMAPAGDSFDLILMIKMPSTESMSVSKQRYDAFMDAYGKANIDQGNKTVVELYNQIREIQGVYLLREVSMK